MTHSTSARSPAHRDLPSFDLDYRFDDEDDPVEVTVFPSDAGDRTTEWLTVDATHAVPLEDVR